jgi:L-2-hydroxyglutarate oxidase LhgO
MDRVECVVIGAGVVGLAAARALALAGREVVLLEAAETIGTGTSSRNSEVVHAGLYYPAGSLKATLCVAGRQALYAYCASRGLGHRRTGKWIVATSEEEVALLHQIKAKAAANGTTDLFFLDAETIRREEPELRCIAALASPSSGIVDSHDLMLSLLGEAEAHGAMIAYRTPVLAVRRAERGLAIETGGAGAMTLACDLLVNAAGLAATEIARRIEGMPAERVPPLRLAKGNYFALQGKAPFRRLIYPVPVPGGLGVHITLDLAGRARFGPDVEWIESIDYRVDPARAVPFYAAVRRYWPGLAEGALMPDYAGIRPKIGLPGGPDADFMIQGPAQHGFAGLINLFGIESPGLTASLAIGGRIAELAKESTARCAA